MGLCDLLFGCSGVDGHAKDQANGRQFVHGKAENGEGKE